MLKGNQKPPSKLIVFLIIPMYFARTASLNLCEPIWFYKKNLMQYCNRRMRE